MKCNITGASLRFGNNVSNSNRRTKRKFKNNIRTSKFFSKRLNRFVRLRTTAGIARTIEKLGGLDRFVEKKQKDYDTKNFRDLKGILLESKKRRNEKSRVVKKHQK